jgi:ribosomal protein S18 acetylase RimI-like enzyme
MLELKDRPLSEFRGALETARFRWLAWDHEFPVGYIDCGTYDRWTTWEGGPNGGGVIATIPAASASITYVVDPKQRRRGYGRALLKELISQPELAHIELFAAGVEPDNLGSIHCLQAAGFHALAPEPDWEGMLYYVRQR